MSNKISSKFITFIMKYDTNKTLKKFQTVHIQSGKTGEVIGNGENYIMRSLMICTPHPILFG